MEVLLLTKSKKAAEAAFLDNAFSLLAIVSGKFLIGELINP